MPNVLLSLPPLYTIVGVYRLVSDPKIRTPVWVSHMSQRPYELYVFMSVRTNAATEPLEGCLWPWSTFVNSLGAGSSLTILTIYQGALTYTPQRWFVGLFLST